MSQIDAVFVSLEYRDDDPDELKSFPFATRSTDYDDTAAMIAELDAVVGICTTALHCADALGVQTWTLVPDKYNWRFFWRNAIDAKSAFRDAERSHMVRNNCKRGGRCQILYLTPIVRS